ncbi:hypothetical protein tinsulaeT_18490 [Thalassotalea insulae]|uniref:PEP-CTERM protein-sorting domain-containing protein n=1 Tax=Thalassotalea insulae TaxID=2056778 RepID=A0ABQ6GSB4_9GAMM|nr:NF038132 family protein [Thalassotalea insulae]GLX78509.1 hypothetical protein tinsulaeT_18490 [Thalassotalea insulae]
MKNNLLITNIKIIASAMLFALSLNTQASVIFDSGLPAGWNCEGTCGTAGADGDVTESSFGGNYGWVATTDGEAGVGLEGIGGTTGSVLTSSLFSAEAGDDLNFFFNYVTSDGAGFADYGWARLLDEAFNQVAILFTARTLESGNIVPGFGMPAPEATLSPATVEIIGGAPTWSPLGGDSGDCYKAGCGYTGWIESNYSIANAGNYYLEFGTVNWDDSQYQSGLAFDGISVGGDVVGEPVDVPEPQTAILFVLALAGLARKKYS